MEMAIIIIALFSFIVILLCFAFSLYVVVLVIGGPKDRPFMESDDTFTPLTEAPLEKLNDFMKQRNQSFNSGRELDVVRDDTTIPTATDLESDPGENLVM